MTSSNAFQQYRNQSIMTATPEELTLMLYNGCIKNILISKSCIDKNNISGANNSIIKAQLIIEEFIATLNMDIPISENLSKIYDYIHNRLVEANISKNIEILDEILDLVTDLRNNWQDAINIYRQNQAPKEMLV